MDADEAIPEMDDGQFWTMIAKADEDFDALRGLLIGLDRGQLIAFAWKFEYLAGLLYDEKYHHNRHSEDYLEDLTSWVVARGRRFYEDVLAHPDKMPSKVNYDETGLDIKFEAEKIFTVRFGESMPAFDGG